MTNTQATPALHQTNALPGIKYHRISKAAEMLGITADELLHRGALGQLSIIAPVMATGRFTWPAPEDRVGYFDMSGELEYEFGPADRVILPSNALRLIEAMGWVIPRQFYSPNVARQAALRHLQVEFVEDDGEILPDDEIELHASAADVTPQKDLELHDNWLDLRRPLFQQQIRERAINGLWTAAGDPAADAPKTTIDHLFVSVREIARLLNGSPLSLGSQIRLEAEKARRTVKQHGNVEVNARPQLEVLRFGLWLHRNEIKEIVGNATRWAAEIEDQAAKLWPPSEEEVKPPLERDVIAKSLRLIFQDDPKKLLYRQ